jgi:hypothetical protein
MLGMKRYETVLGSATLGALLWAVLALQWIPLSQPMYQAILPVC